MQSGTESSYYPGPTKGAQTGSCIAPSDYGSPMGGELGFWQFMIMNGPGATYIDPDNPGGLDGYFHGFTESECHALVYEIGDTNWKDAKLSDVF